MKVEEFKSLYLASVKLVAIMTFFLENPLKKPFQNFHGKFCIHFYTLKKCSLLKMENSSSWVNFTHFREKTNLLALELIFVSSGWRVYMYIKFDIENESLEWYKKRSIFAKWAIQKNSDALATTHRKWKN